MKNYSLGFDAGSEFLHGVVLDRGGNVLYAPKSILHRGNLRGSLEALLEDFSGKGFGEKNSIVSFTGSAGKVLASEFGGNFFYETVAIPQGAHILDESAEHVFHIGSKKNYYFQKAGLSGKRVYVLDDDSGTKCGGGSGILLSKQARRLFGEMVEGDGLEAFEEMHRMAYEEALKYDRKIDVGGRCGVVIQSDMIHLQNKGENLPNILRALYERVAVNYISNVLGNREFRGEGTAVFTGGVSFNDYIRRMFEEHLGINVLRPDHAEKVGAVGSAFLGVLDAEKGRGGRFNLIKSDKKIVFVDALHESLDKVVVYPDEEYVRKGDLRVFPESFNGGIIEAVMGVDGGSTTTKAMVLDVDSKKPVAEICVDTHGRPIQAAQNIFRQIRDYFGEKLSVERVVYTGSSGAFYRNVFSSKDSGDGVVDEITCHFKGVEEFDERVDTICELGGQDAKFTRVDGSGIVKKAKMNLSCMAGTGQTMKNMIDMLGLDYKGFEELALSADKIPVVDDTCGVFTEAGILELVEKGFPIEEIAAAIAYGFLGGYVNKFVGNESFGDFVSAQGGPFNSRACLASLAHHTGLQINAFPHRQLFGAYGAALEARNLLNGNGI